MAKRRKRQMIGRLDRRITLQKIEVTRNDLNEEVRTWVEQYSRSAAVEYRRGGSNETLEALQEVSTNNVVFTLRYIADVNAKMRVLYDDHIFDILFVNELTEYGRRRYMELICEQKDDTKNGTTV